MEKLESKKEITETKNFHQLIDFLQENFGENITEKFFRSFLEQKANAVLTFQKIDEKEKAKRLKSKKITPEIVEEINNIISARLEFIERDLENADKLKDDVRQETEEMFKTLKDKEVVIGEDGNLEIEKNY